MFYLNVPFSDKNEAKDYGAVWDGSRWGVPDDVELVYFKKWIPKEQIEIAEQIIASQTPENGVKLSNLLNTIKLKILNNTEGFYWINAEIANIKEQKNNLYLELIETDRNGRELCKARGVVLSNELDYIKEKFKITTGKNLEKGMKVLVRVRVSFDIKYHLSLIVLDIDPVHTLGGMESKILLIKDQIIKLNLFNKNKNKSLSGYFKKIAVVSPVGAAGLGDFKADADLLEKHDICKFKYYTATFQGSNTWKEVSTAIKKASFDAKKENYDAIVVIRGGGAKTDLHFLNEFDIAKAICEASVPVFVGVGHEIDHVFIDEIANKSFDTPSKVIGFIASTNINMYKSIESLKNSIKMNSEKWLNQYKEKNKYLNELIKRSNKTIILKHKQEFQTSKNCINEKTYFIKGRFKLNIEELRSKIKIASTNKKELFRNDLRLILSNINHSNKMVRINYLNTIKSDHSKILQKSPLNTLDNGYAIIKTENNDVITTIKELKNNNNFVIMMKDGEIKITLN